EESIVTLKINYFPTHDPHYYQVRELYQSLLFCPECEEKQYEEMYQDLEFIRWHPVSVDILAKCGSKAIGIEQIAQRLRASTENIYAFGDGRNDIEMLQSVENSVAMGNAEERVKQAAKHVTKSVEEDGILHGLQMVGLL